MKWKVCGMREEENCVEVAHANPDFMGFIFAKKSPRYVGENYKIPVNIAEEIQKVGVFVDETVERIMELSASAGFTWVQLHGEEGEEQIEQLKKGGLRVIKAISVSSEEDVEKANHYAKLPDYFLFDTKKGAQVGGTGERFDWSILEAYKAPVPIILAGGLDVESVEAAIELSKKYPIEVLDFNSKLEVSPGVKEVTKVSRVSNVIKSL